MGLVSPQEVAEELERMRVDAEGLERTRDTLLELARAQTSYQENDRRPISSNKSNTE